MLFSVIVPMYNAEKYIRECVESVLNQSEKDFELIIVDDGSTDKSSLIADEYAMNDNRVRVIHQMNMGLFHTRCVAIEKSLGKYVVFVDADDLLKNNALQRLKSEVITGHFDMIIYRAETFYENGEVVFQKKLFEDDSIFEKDDKKQLYYRIISDECLNDLWIKAIEINCFKTSKMWSFPRITMGEDLVHTLEPITNAKRIKYIDDVLYSYRIVNDSMTRSYQSNVFDSVKFVHLELRKYILDWKMDSFDIMQLYNKRFLKRICSISLFAPFKIKGKESEYIKMLSIIKNDDLFNKAYQETYKNLSFIFKIPVALIRSGRLKILLYFKPIVTKMRA